MSDIIQPSLFDADPANQQEAFIQPERDAQIAEATGQLGVSAAAEIITPDEVIDPLTKREEIVGRDWVSPALRNRQKISAHRRVEARLDAHPAYRPMSSRLEMTDEQRSRQYAINTRGATLARWALKNGTQPELSAPTRPISAQYVKIGKENIAKIRESLEDTQ